MSKNAEDRLIEFVRTRCRDHHRADGEIRAFLEKGIVVHMPGTGKTSPVRVYFGKMPMAAEMTLSISCFTALLVMTLLVEDSRYPYMPYGALAVLIGNFVFEFSRYRIAKKFVDDVRDVI